MNDNITNYDFAAKLRFLANHITNNNMMRNTQT